MVKMVSQYAPHTKCGKGGGNFMKVTEVARYLKTFLSLNIPTDTKKEVDGYNWAKSSGCSAEELRNYVELSAEVGRKNQFDFGIERYLREITEELLWGEINIHLLRLL
jgi:hypothetical protein